MEAALIPLAVQGALGAVDILWNHEWRERLPSRPGARRELALHAWRDAIYGPLFVLLAWYDWRGWLAVLLALLLAAELLITLADFVEEDRSRTLPANERVMHTLMALNYGVVLALLAPEIVAWSRLETAFVAVDRGAWAWLLTAYGLGAAVWGLRDALAARALGRRREPAWRARPLAVGRRAEPRALVVLGATGFVGAALVRRLVADGERVTVVARDPAKAADLFGPHVEIVDSLEALGGDRPAHAVVNLAGAPLASRWTPARKAELVESRFGVTRALAAWIAARPTPPAVLVNASAIGWYGVSRDAVFDERAPAGDDFPARLCRAWERAADEAAAAGVRVVKLRFGLVLGRGGMLGALLPVFRAGLGAPFGGGAQWMSWVHLDDAVAAIRRVLDDPALAGPVNVVAPEAARARDFARSLAGALGRPLWPAIPAFALRAALGEMATLVLDGQRVVPAALLRAGFRFRHPTLAAALAATIDPSRDAIAAADPEPRRA